MKLEEIEEHNQEIEEELYSCKLKDRKRKPPNIDEEDLQIFQNMTDKEIEETIKLDLGIELGLDKDNAKAIDTLFEFAAETYPFNDDASLLKTVYDNDLFIGLPIIEKCYNEVEKIIFNKYRFLEYDDWYLNDVCIVNGGKKFILTPNVLIKTTDNHYYLFGIVEK